MPIELNQPIRVLDQDAFGKVAYEVMQHAFQIHNDMGRFFDEEAYQQELAHLLGPRAVKEACIRVKHLDFCKTYFIDLLVDQGAVFELKTVDRLMDKQRSQLLSYLLLTGCCHGKLLNFRPERIEHEFLNTSLTLSDRAAFAVNDSAWNRDAERAAEIRKVVEDFLRDWGTGLDLQLYVDALTHFLGGENQVVQDINVLSGGRRIGSQRIRLAGTCAAFKFTALPRRALDGFESHAMRFLKHTDLKHVFWINVTLRELTFKTLSKTEI